MRLRRFALAVRGQAMVETALVLPLFIMVIAGIIVLGIGLFYQQQITNAAREAARYAAIHSATSLCPVSSRLPPNSGLIPAEITDAILACPTGEPTGSALTSWHDMQEHGRQRAGFGFDESALHFAACWSGYQNGDAAVGADAHDAPAFQADDGTANAFDDCTIGGFDPVTEIGALTCPPPVTVDGDDTASNIAVSSGGTANQVTVYACYQWQPPLAGFLLIPQSVTFRATISESLQHQR